MSYKTELQGNNVDLQSVLDAVNALPEQKSLAELTADADATAADIINGKKAYVDGELVTGTANAGKQMVTGKVNFTSSTPSFSISGFDFMPVGFAIKTTASVSQFKNYYNTTHYHTVYLFVCINGVYMAELLDSYDTTTHAWATESNWKTAKWGTMSYGAINVSVYNGGINSTFPFYGEYEYVIWGDDIKSDNESGSGANLISFTISDNSYQAEEGMTWKQWVESDYNTDGFTYEIEVTHPSGHGSVASTTYEKPTNVIIANYAYEIWG